MTKSRMFSLLLLSMLASAPHTSSASTHYAIVTESVNNYAPCNGGSNSSNLTSNAAADNFYNTMLKSPNSAEFENGPQWQDNGVFDGDFLDPDLANHAPGSPDDTYNFDNSLFGISFYAGHGDQLAKSSVTCTSYAQCSAANAGPGLFVGLSGYGTCAISPGSVATLGSGTGICNYAQPTTVNPTIAVCSTGSTNSNHAQFGYMALGETPATGAWRGAGTNGGTSLAIIHMSFSMWTFFPETMWWSMFAGTHLIAADMTSWGDIDGDAVNYGTEMATSYQTNPYGQVEEAYVNTFSSDQEGGGCANDGSPHGGFNGCGCSFVMSISSTNAGAQAAFTEDWYSLEQDLPTQNGSGYWYWNAVCNYNTSTYPWSGGD
jgi:hypothetical protein